MKKGKSHPQRWETRDPTERAGTSEPPGPPSRVPRAADSPFKHLLWNYPGHKHFLFKHSLDPCSEKQLIYYKSLHFRYFLNSSCSASHRYFSGYKLPKWNFWCWAGISSSQHTRQSRITFRNWYIGGLADDFQPQTQFLCPSGAWEGSGGPSPQPRCCCWTCCSLPDRHLHSARNSSPSQSKLVCSRRDLHKRHCGFPGDLAGSPAAEGTRLGLHGSAGATQVTPARVSLNCS